jgi:probable F420-dependent oxidoreductase
MQIGVICPQSEIGGDVGAVRAYGQRVEQLGYQHLLAYDHVLGADPAVHKGWDGPYDVNTTFHEPFVLFGFLAALTSLELVTGVIILPQRQTALVAKQAAEVDLLTQGHFRLGIGLGWNAVEYEALGKDFSTRGRRVSEQIELLRRLWTQPSVTFAGNAEQITGAGIAPLPIQRPIPLWFGAHSHAGLSRAGRVGDGWFPQAPPGPKLDRLRKMVDEAAVEVGRDPSTLGMEGRLNYKGNTADLVAEAAQWEKLGASHVGINTMRAGLETVDDHLAVLADVAVELGIS